MTSTDQTASALWLVKPLLFAKNNETAVTNAFQKTEELNANAVNDLAQNEFQEMCRSLKEAGITFYVSESTDANAPDAVFPNNWISFHHDGTLILYPMMAVSRRRERDLELLEIIKSKFDINRVCDFTESENENRFLEGTGSIVFDHKNKTAFAALSPRTNADVLNAVCNALGYEAQVFSCSDRNGLEVYHTNVLLHIGETYAVLCADAIADSREREIVIQKLKRSNRALIEISFDQMEAFAGNMLQVKNEDDELITIISATAFNSLSDHQFSELLEHTKLLRIAVPQIENSGGGSVRCMLAEIFLPEKNNS